MPFSGTGIFTRVYQWVNDAANNLDVDATRTDTDSNDIADGLTNCITRDGQSPATANIPLGGFKLTGVGTGTAATDGVNFAQVFVAPSFTGGITYSGGLIGTGNVTLTAGVIDLDGATSVLVPTVAPGDNTTNAASTAFVTQAAFGAALPAQSLGFLRSSGTVAAFTQTHTGYAQKEVRGADIASAANINLTTATGNYLHITGTTGPVTSFTIPAGAEYTLVWDAAATITYNATSMILPGAVSRTVEVGEVWKVRADTADNARVTICTSSGLAVTVATVGDHEVMVHTGNGYGSTNTKIRRFTTTLTNVGTAITYADSATLGASFTINETGLYSVDYVDAAGGGIVYGISLNSALLTTNIDAIAPSNRPCGYQITSGNGAQVGRVLRLVAGDVLRPHTNAAATPDTSNYDFFAIRKVAK